MMAFKREVLRTGRGARTETEVTVEGEKFYFDLVAEPLRDPDGTIVGLTCSATDITSAKKSLLERERLIAQLQEALEEVKMLSGLLSICASCKRIMNEHQNWEPLESYIQSHSEAKFSHGVCPDCLTKTISGLLSEEIDSRSDTGISLPRHVSQASCVRTR